MIRFLLPALMASLLALPGISQDDSTTRKQRLERFQKLTPEQKKGLRERMDQFGKLSPEEKRRMRENFHRFKQLSPGERQGIREKIEKLPPEERRAMSELASGFNRWAHKQGFQEGFPRDLFFGWLKDSKHEELRKLREMDPLDRRDAFVKLFYEFKDRCLDRMVEDNRRHRRFDEAEIQSLRDASAREFWQKHHDMMRRGRPPRRPGPPSPR